jgi:hypothetical protein
MNTRIDYDPIHERWIMRRDELRQHKAEASVGWALAKMTGALLVLPANSSGRCYALRALDATQSLQRRFYRHSNACV